MQNVNRSLVVLIVSVLAVSSFVVFESASSQATPSVPEFTVQYVDASYDIPSTTSADPYTGQNVTQQGYHVENRTIVLTIKNQPFNDAGDATFFYNVRMKGNHEQNWTEIYTPSRGLLSRSNLDSTMVSYSAEGGFPFWDDLPSGAEVDFQVQALVGILERATSEIFSGYEFKGVTSGWSNTQTVKLPQEASASPSPTVPEFPLTLFVFLSALVVSMAVVALKRKQHSQNL